MLLEGIEFSRSLLSSIYDTRKTLVLCSAFIKEKALRHEVFQKIDQSIDVLVIVRWQKNDILFGASDLSVYEFCKERGWKLGVDLNLHGKLFLLDQEKIYLGSANLTQKGLHIGIVGNNEFGTCLDASSTDLSKIQSYINSEVTWLNDEIFKLISLDVENMDSNNGEIDLGWSADVRELLTKPVEHLWVQDLLFNPPEAVLKMDLDDPSLLHDFELLGLNVDLIDSTGLARAFIKTKMYAWMCCMLGRANGLYYGELTKKLHDAVLDDPKPYRVEIKNLLSVMFAWAEFLDSRFKVSRPNHSQYLEVLD